MSVMNRFFILTLLFAFVTTSIQGQECCDETNMECDGSAYMEASKTAHWSIYIPIAILVVAAIWFGVADQHDNSKSKYSYTDPLDGLGSIDNSKRHSSRIGSYGYSSYSRSKATIGHH